MTMRLRLTATLCGALALGWSGAFAEEPAPAPAPAPATEPAPAPAPAPATEPAPAPAPAADNQGDKANQLLEQHAAEEKQLREEIRVQVQSHLDAAERLLAASEFEAARAELERALTLDRGNQKARDLLSQVNDRLGDRIAKVQQAAKDFEGYTRVAIQERLVELQNRIDWGNRFYNQAVNEKGLTVSERIGKLEQSRQNFERAKEIIKWLPVKVNTDEENNTTMRMLGEIRRTIAALKEQSDVENKKRSQDIADSRAAYDREQDARKIAVLIDQARALFEHGNFAEAEKLAGRILELDPFNSEAHSIEIGARDRKHIAAQRWIREEKEEQGKRQIERADRMAIPNRDYLIYPDNWTTEVSKRTGENNRPRQEDPWKAEARKRLAKKVSFEFVDTPLEEAVNFLNAMSKVNIIIDPRVLADAGKVPVTLKVADMDMETALKWILRMADLDYDIKNQAVFITKKGGQETNIELQIYDVRDMTYTINDFPGPHVELGVNAQAGGAGGGPFAPPAPVPQVTPDDLAALIREKLLVTDFQIQGTSIDNQAGRLVVMQKPEVHEKIREILNSFRETQTIQVLTQVRFIDVTDGFLEQIGVSFSGLDNPVGQDYNNNNNTGAQIYDPLRAATYNPSNPWNPFLPPSRFGLMPQGGGLGQLTFNPATNQIVNGSPTYLDPSLYQYMPPAQQLALGGVFNRLGVSANPQSFVGQYLHPRLDPRYPTQNLPGPFGNNGNAPVGVRQQWGNIQLDANGQPIAGSGSPVLLQQYTANVVNYLTSGPLGNTLSSNVGRDGALFQFRFLGNVQANAVLQAIRKDQTSDLLLSPRLTQFNNQRAHVLVAQERAYIADYDISGNSFDPVIRSYLTGVVLEVRPTVSHDRKYITLDLRSGTATELTPPAVVTIGGAFNLPIQLPNLELRSINTTVAVPDNGTLLYSGLINDSKFDTHAGVPLLSDLPIIGRLFGTNLKQRERRNLLILVNSRVILFDEEEAKL